MKIKNRRLVACLMATLTIMSTGAVVAVAYWLREVFGDKDTGGNNVIIGNGRTAETTVTISPDGKSDGSLIPITLIPGDDETTEVMFYFNIKWSVDTDLTALVPSGTERPLVINCIAITIDQTTLEDEADIDLFIITIGDYTVVAFDEEGTDVEIKIEMNEPADEDQYLLVVGKAISFTFEFEVEDYDLSEDEPAA